MSVLTQKEAPQQTLQQDFLPLNGTDYVELYVSNAKQAAHFYKTAFGFQDLAYKGLETGDKQTESYVIIQDKIRLVLTSPLHSDSAIGRHIDKHGDGVRVIALWVDDATDAWKQTTSRGAKSFMEPTVEEDAHGRVVRSGIHIYGETVHVFVERKDYHGTFLPGFMDWKTTYNPAPVGLKYIDHMVGNVSLGRMDYWVKFYEDVMGFKNILSFDDKDISTEYSALMSKVMQNGNGRVKFPINEPAEGKRKSQIEEYLDYYLTPGAQHIAIITGDILSTIEQLRKNGVEFLRVPKTYYEMLPDRIGQIKEDYKAIQELGILVDKDDEGYLLQIFSKPIQDRPTLFVEIIQRHGAQGFGKGNFKALFEAIEREQARRGNL